MVYCVESDESGFLWVGTENGLSRYDGYNYRLIDQLGSEVIGEAPVHSIDIVGRDLLVSSWSKIYLYNLQEHKCISIKTSFDRISKATVNNGYIICMSDGADYIWTYNINTKKEHEVYANSGDIVQQLFQGSAEVSVLINNSVYILNLETLNFVRSETGDVFGADNKANSYIALDSIKRLFKDVADIPAFRDFSLYAASSKRVFLADRLELYYWIDGEVGRIKTKAPISDLWIDGYMNLWVATEGKGVALYSSSFFVPKEVSYDNSTSLLFDQERKRRYVLKDSVVKTFIGSEEQKDNQLLLGLNQKEQKPALIDVDGEGNLLVAFNDGNVIKLDFANNKEELLYSGNSLSEAILLSSLNKGFCYISRNKIVHFSDSITEHSVPHVYDAVVDGDVVWIATVDGLFNYNLASNELVAWKEKIGFSFGKITSVEKQNEHDLWLVHSSRFYCYKTNTDSLYSYSTYVSSGEIAPNSLKISGDSIYYTVGSKHWAIKISKMKTDEVLMMPLKVVDAKILGGYVSSDLDELKYLQKESSEGLLEVNVAYTNTFSNFYFNSIDYAHSIPFRIRYKLDGYDSHWHWADDKKVSVNYTSMHGGEYVLKSEVMDVKGNVVAKGRDMLYVVEYAFWETWWFLVGALIVVALVLYFAYTARISRVVRMRTLLEKQVDQRTLELQEKTEEIRQQKEVLLDQRDQANMQKSEISKQKDQLEKQQEQLEKYANVQKQALQRSEVHFKEAVKKKEYFESIYKLVAESCSDVVFRIQLPDEIFDFVSPAVLNITGYSPEEIYESKGVFWKMFAPEFKDYGQMLRQNLRVGEVRPVCEYKIVTKSGEQKWIRQKNILVKDKLANPIALEGVLVDISEEKAEESSSEAAMHRVEEADALKSVCNDSKSDKRAAVISTIAGFAELLSDPEVSLDEREGYLQKFSESSSALLLLIDDLIDFSKLEASQIEINKSQCYVNSIIKDVHTAFEGVRKQNGLDDLSINYKLGVKEDSFAIFTDTFRLKQILTKLVGNALQFTSSGLIEVGYRLDAEDESQSLLFYVKDTGKGIPNEQLPKVFDRHTTINEDTTVGDGKLNLGLAIARSLVELLGGKIWVESKLGIGSVFWFSLPFDKQKGLKTKQKTDSKTFVEDWANRTFLVAEDEDNNYRFIKAALRKTGVSLIRAKDGQEAVSIFTEKRNSIDLILMDIQMPIMNGYDATRHIKEIDKNVPIIAQTAFAMTGGKVKCFDAGCDGYISKPYKAKDIIATISKYLEY